MLRCVRVTLVTALLLSGGGCKKAMMGASAPDYGYDGSYATADYGEAMPTAPAAPMEDSPSSTLSMDRVAEREYARQAPANREIASPPVERPVVRFSGSVDAEVGGSRPEPADERPTDDVDGRHIVYTAMMSISVFNVDEAREAVETLPERHGGYLQSMNEGSLILRIPSKNLRKAMAELEKLGVVEHRTLQTQDVTAEYVDIESRIRVLEETQRQLIDLLSKARTVEEALRVRTALDQVTMDLEVLKGRMRQLRNLVSYSTLTVQLSERGPHSPIPSENDPFPWVDELGVEATEWK